MSEIMMTIKKAWQNTLIFFGSVGICVLMGPLLLSCDDDSKCHGNSDCGGNRICIHGDCVTNPRSTDDSATASDSTSDSTVPSTDTDDFQTDTIRDTDTVPYSDTPCLSNLDCDDGNPCTRDSCNLNAEPYRCRAVPIADGTTCNDGDACRGQGVCQNGMCTGAEPLCVTTTLPGECVTYVATCTPDAADVCAYTATPVENGTPCTMGDACSRGACLDGECMDAQNPCNVDDSPCEISTCVASGTRPDDFECQRITVPDGEACRILKVDDPCATSSGTPDYVDGYCFAQGNAATCFAGENRICFDAALPNICTAQVCVQEDGSCADVPVADVSVLVNCGDTVALTAADFITREYWQYPSPCAPIDVRGKEVALTVGLTAATAVTVTVTDDGGQSVSLHHLTDMCDPTTCQDNAIGTLTIPAMQPADAIVVEAGIGEPPTTIQLSISCN